MRSIDLHASQEAISSGHSRRIVGIVLESTRCFSIGKTVIATSLFFLGSLGVTIHTSAYSFEPQGNITSSAGRPFVLESVMATQCTTMVSPQFPLGATASRKEAVEVVLRVLVKRTGVPSPLFLVSGQQAFENEAMNAVRLWRYRPYLRDGDPIDVVTNVRINFIPGQPAGMVTHPRH